MNRGWQGMESTMHAHIQSLEEELRKAKHSIWVRDMDLEAKQIMIDDLLKKNEELENYKFMYEGLDK